MPLYETRKPWWAGEYPSFEERLDIENKLKWTKATNIQVDERTIVVTWQSKLARKVFEERHPGCLLPDKQF